MSDKNTGKEEQKKRGQKREREGEGEHPSSGKDKTARAVGKNSSFPSLPVPSLTSRLKHPSIMDDDEEENEEMKQAIAASLETSTSSSSSSSAPPENKPLTADKMDQSSDAAKNVQFQERLLLFVLAAESNDFRYLEEVLNPASPEERFALIKTHCSDYADMTALEVASKKGHREAVDTMLNFLSLEKAEEVVDSIWEEISGYVDDENDCEYSNWQELCVGYLENRKKKEALGKGASSSSSSSQPVAPVIATQEEIFINAILENNTAAFETWSNNLATPQERLPFINFPLVAFEGATILETAINSELNGIVAALLKGLPIKEKEQLLGKINLPDSRLLKELREQLNREKTAEHKSSGNGSNSDMPPTDTIKAEGDKSEKKERSGKEECDPDEIPSATTAIPPPIRPNAYWEEEEKPSREKDKEREKESEIHSHFIKSMNQLREAVSQGNLGDACSILLNASMSGADKTTIFTPLEFLTSDDLLKLYRLFVNASATFKTASISVTDLEDYVVLKLQEGGKNTVEAYAMLSSPHQNNSSSSSSNSNATGENGTGGGSGIVLPPLSTWWPHSSFNPHSSSSLVPTTTVTPSSTTTLQAGTSQATTSSSSSSSSNTPNNNSDSRNNSPR